MVGPQYGKTALQFAQETRRGAEHPTELESTVAKIQGMTTFDMHQSTPFIRAFPWRERTLSTITFDLIERSCFCVELMARPLRGTD